MTDQTSTRPMPQWLAALSKDMRGDLTDAMGGWANTERIDDIAARATTRASYYLHDMQVKWRRAELDAEKYLARIAELEADVRSLGGDPDRMVDPVEQDEDDFAANLRARMRRELEVVAGAHIRRLLPVADAATTVALSVARPLLDAMTKGSEEVAELRQRCAWLARTTPAPEVREVPAGEAREGDTVTYVRRGTVDRLYHHQTGRLGVIWDDEPGAICTVHPDKPITVSRPVSPLPDQPGAVIRCEVQDSAWALVAELHDDGRWYATDGRNYRPEDVTEFTVLAGAGVDEGGKS